MLDKRSWWPIWAQKLQRWGVSEPIAALLDAAGPLSALAAQAIYLGQPLFGSTAAEGGWSAAAEMLANPQESRTFASFLRKEGEID
jgi:hypothetical protein